MIGWKSMRKKPAWTAAACVMSVEVRQHLADHLVGDLRHVVVLGFTAGMIA